MQGKVRKIILDVIASMAILAMVILWPTESQAQNALRPSRPSPPKPPPSRSVPEPSTSVLLLLGIGLTSLIGYSLQRRRHAE
jgi:hypothetical protein